MMEPTPISPEALSPLLPRCEVEARLGSDEIASVYSGRQTELDREVTIYLLHATSSDHLRVEEDIQAIARLEHPNIAPILHFGPVQLPEMETPTPCIVVERVAGTDLAARLQVAPLPVTECLKILL
ncbi:MAG: hypothetical protein AAF492_10355, partial [Verrucomicrobiota bacterium]